MKWTITNSTPAITPGRLHPGYDDRRAGAAHVIRRDDRYLMVYWGTGSDGKNHILAAESPVDDPNAWKPWGRPLIGPQEESDHNCVGPGFPFLLPLTESHWLLYFCGWGRSVGGKLPNTTGVAISDDAGQSWRYHDTHPVFPLDRPYDHEATGSIWIMKEEGRLRMYYTAIGSYGPRPEGAETGHGDTIPQIGIGYAESNDGLHWEKPFDDWVVKPRGFGVEPYEYICSKPCIVKADDGYLMWVNTFGTAYRVHRLRSDDGLHWEWLPRVGPDGEVGMGAAGAFDDHQRSYPCVVQHGDSLRCWYTGNGFGSTGMGYGEMMRDA